MFCFYLYMTTLGAKPHLLVNFISYFSLVAAFHLCWAIPTQTKFICISAPENLPPFNILSLLNLSNSYPYSEA